VPQITPEPALLLLHNCHFRPDIDLTKPYLVIVDGIAAITITVPDSLPKQDHYRRKMSHYHWEGPFAPQQSLLQRVQPKIKYILTRLDLIMDGFLCHGGKGKQI